MSPYTSAPPNSSSAPANTRAHLQALERPRERLLVFGPAALADVELIALLLGGGHAVQRALRLLQHAGGLAGLAQAIPQELLECRGVGEASASSICAAIELARRIARLDLPYQRPLRDPGEVSRFAREALRGAPQETFLVVGLDARQFVRVVRTVGLGSISRVEVHPREVFRPLIRAGVHSALFVHNHPSGERMPSQSDIRVTQRLAEIGDMLGIPVLDHIVVTDFSSVSMAEQGLMPAPLEDEEGAGA
ncbi:MAG: DNA repair protein RadC [Myxococcales bacterium]|nr:DNA repair protein RadC [Myxococcales bacterium]